MRTVKIDVTAEDIAAGVREDACSCPIALACRRAGLSAPLVDGSVVTARRGVWYEMAVLPVAAKDFVEAFDDGRPVVPFAFEAEFTAAGEDDVDAE